LLREGHVALEVLVSILGGGVHLLVLVAASTAGLMATGLVIAKLVIGKTNAIDVANEDTLKETVRTAQRVFDVGEATLDLFQGHHLLVVVGVAAQALAVAAATAGLGLQLLEGNAVLNVLRKDQGAQPTTGALMQRGLQKVVTVVFPLMEAGAQGRW